jgi:GNAT superfamily N-acetyltransferase
MEVRSAGVADVADICRVVRASIIELCLADHRCDPAILAGWLTNKTPENVSAWLANPNNINLVAVDRDIVVGAGCVTVSGQILLNYVCPSARFRGVSSALLADREASARQRGNRRCVLESTATAHRFYLRRGYRDQDAPGGRHGLTTFPMTKEL